MQEAKTLQVVRQAIAEKLKQKVLEMAQKVQEQSFHTLLQAQLTKVEQENLQSNYHNERNGMCKGFPRWQQNHKNSVSDGLDDNEI